jgi:hypothetical protein
MTRGSLEERLRRAIITEYLMVRRWRKDEALDLAKARFESRIRLDAYKTQVEGKRHYWVIMPRTGGDEPCYVCGLDYEAHNEAMIDMRWGSSISFPEIPNWENNMYEAADKDRLVADCTMEIVNHMRDLLKGYG